MAAASKGRVAIASCHDKVNFGSVLQAWATQEAVCSLGYEAVTIDKRGLGAEIGRGRRGYYAGHVLDLGLYRAKLGFVGHRVRQKLDGGFGAKMRQRREAFAAFERSAFDFTDRTATFAELGQLVSSYDTVLVGSDQLWLPVNIAGDYFTLSWVQPPTHKVAYSTSFGVSELPGKYLRRTGEFLVDFDAVSVREDSGADLVQAATGRRCCVVCDPTMLLPRQRWEQLAADVTVEPPQEPYLLCYFLGKNIWNRECAKRLADERGLKVVAIAHPDEYVAFDDTYADVYPWKAGPADWVRLVLGASFVCTDSFHGTVFSSVFEVPFVSFRRHQGMGAQSTNSRLDTLLGALGQPDRICEAPGDFDAIAARDIDFPSLRSRLQAYRAESLEFLESALAGEGT